MRKEILIFICQLGILPTMASNLSSIQIESLHSEVLTVEPTSNSGLNIIYVVNSPDDITITYTSTTGRKAIWEKFYDQGVAYSQTLDVTYENNISVLKNAEVNHGYMISDGESEVYFWIIDYSNYSFVCDSLSISPKSNCYETVLDFVGEASPIIYYGTTGKQNILSRGIELEYSTLIWDENKNDFTDQYVVKTLDSINKEIQVTPPVYSETSFILKGDIISEFFKNQKMISTPSYLPIAVDSRTTIIQDEQNNSTNVISSGNTGLGGNAPCKLQFIAETTPGVIHNEWQVALDADFIDILYRFNDSEIEHTFSESGTYYVRFVGSNQDGSCETISDGYNIEIGESQLLVPNFFSPNNDNINDEWKVSYQSITEFECWIFDKTGKQIFHFSNPSEGWDGKINGRTVKSGVFFYVIKAVGADKKIYELSGDINVISSSKKLQTD